MVRAIKMNFGSYWNMQSWGRRSNYLVYKGDLSKRTTRFFSVVLLQLSQFFPHCSPLSCPPPAPRVNPYPVVHAHVSSIHVPSLDPSLSFLPSPHPPPLWSLSVCFLFPCLWFCFAHLFVLFTRFPS